ncbi:MAG: branched-chain amino acid transport system II carrier protein [Anaerovorax sp.]
MNEKLSTSNIISLSLMLFAMFFGAGNMIFPPALAQLAGTNYLQGLAGFMLTDIGISVLAILAIVLAGSTLDDLAGRVSPRFSVFLTVIIYLLIGPLFALPRTGTVSFELAILPFLPKLESTHIFISILFTFIFFAVTYILALNPHKVVDIVGKLLTPFLLISIAIIFVGSLIHPIGAIGIPTGDYATVPLFKGMIEGYLALDGLAALVFAIIVINSIKDKGITHKKNIVKYTLMTGIFAAIALTIVYIALGYIGASSASLGTFENGGQLLSAVTHLLFGKSGNIILGLAVLMACLTTSIGLVSSFGDYFHKLFPNYSYAQITLVVCIFSFAISNIGLTQLIKVTLPILMMVYPVAVVLIVVSFFDKWFQGKSEVYALGMLFSFVVGAISGLENAGIVLGQITLWAHSIPLYELGIGWVLPGALGCLLGALPFVKIPGCVTTAQCPNIE